MQDILNVIAGSEAVLTGWGALLDLFDRYMGRPYWTAAFFGVLTGGLLTFSGRSTWLSMLVLFGGLAGAHHAHSQGGGVWSSAVSFMIGGVLCTVAFFLAVFALGWGLAGFALESLDLHPYLQIGLSIAAGALALVLLDIVVMVVSAAAGALLATAGIAHFNALLDLGWPMTTLNPVELAQALYAALISGGGDASAELGATGVFVVVLAVTGLATQIKASIRAGATNARPAATPLERRSGAQEEAR